MGSTLWRFSGSILLVTFAIAFAILWFQSRTKWDAVVVNTPWNHLSIFSEESIAMIHIKIQPHGEWNGYHERTAVTGHVPLWPTVHQPTFQTAKNELKILVRYGTLVVTVFLLALAVFGWELSRHNSLRDRRKGAN